MKSRIIIATLIAIALFSTIVYANAGDNPGQIIDNPWGDPVTTTAPTTEAPTTTEEPTTEVPTETIPADSMYEVSPYRPSADPIRLLCKIIFIRLSSTSLRLSACPSQSGRTPSHPANPSAPARSSATC